MYVPTREMSWKVLQSALLEGWVRPWDLVHGSLEEGPAVNLREHDSIALQAALGVFRLMLLSGRATPADLYDCFGARVSVLSSGGMDPLWREVLDFSPMMVGVSSAKECVFLNRAYAQYTGCPGPPYPWQSYIHCEDLPAVLDAFNRAEDASWQVPSYRLRGMDGRYRRFDSWVIPHYDAEGRLAGYMGWNRPAIPFEHGCEIVGERREGVAFVLEGKGVFSFIDAPVAVEL